MNSTHKTPRHTTSLADTAYDLAAMRVQLKATLLWRAILKANYNPNQPRSAAGNPDGGQWTKIGGSENNRSNRQDLASKFDWTGDCDEQFERDLFHCRMVGMPSCCEQAKVRLNACGKRQPIPPLNY